MYLHNIWLHCLSLNKAEFELFVIQTNSAMTRNGPSKRLDKDAIPRRRFWSGIECGYSSRRIIAWLFGADLLSDLTIRAKFQPIHANLTWVIRAVES